MVTGPVFAPLFLNNQWVYMHKTVGTFPHLVSVPTHYYKVILGRPAAGNNNHNADVVVAAFLFPNHNHVDKAEPLASLLVRLDQLESIGKWPSVCARSSLLLVIVVTNRVLFSVGYQFFPSLLDDKDKEKLDVVVPAYR